MARVGIDATPIAQRDAAYLIGIEANWDDPADDEANRGWARDVATALTPYSTGSSYLNFEDVIEAAKNRRKASALICFGVSPASSKSRTRAFLPPQLETRRSR